MAENENISPAAPQQPTPQPQAPKTSVVKPTVVQSGVKKGRKLSPRVVVFGCLGFIAVFIIGLFGALYVGLQNPARLSNIGIAPANAKSLLMIIAGVFFGVIFLFGFGFLAINTYRLVKNKGGSKAKYLGAMFFGLILLGIAIGLGAVAITKVQGIKVDLYANTDELVVPYLITSTNNAATQTEYTYAKANGIYMIAPVDIAYQINATIVNLKYKNVAGANPPLSMVLDCGNGDRNIASQKVNGAGYIGGKNAFFDSTCLYTKKGTYAPKITFTYRDPVKQQNQTFTLDAGTLTITAQLDVNVNGLPAKTNSGNSEIIAGDAPVRVQIDAKNIFSELGIADNNIIRDMDTDGTPDKENKVTFGYNFIDPKLYTVSYRFPNSPGTLSNLRYHFYLRVNQSDAPRCSISAKNQGNTYDFSTIWSGGADVSADINNYHWEIYDLDNEKTIDTIPTRDDTLEYTFTKQGNYTARLNFSTIDNINGLCESDAIHAGAPAYDLSYSVAYKKPGESSFTAFPTTGTISQSGDQVIIDGLPIDIQVTLTDIVPKPVRATVKVKIDDKYMSEKSPTVFRTTLNDKKDHIITITVQDEQGTTVERKINVTLNQSIIQGILKADIYNGTEPLTVTLDASTTKLNDDKDEIIYFTWNFGDGEQAKNVSQGRISHVYTFNQKLQSGQYVPTVTVTTKKGYTATFPIDIPISVTRKASTVQVRLPSNPTQVALQNTSVDMEMISDGPISKISWDFGDGDTYYCNDRSCATTKHTYKTPGDYTVTVRVEYQDRPFAVDSIKLKVQ